MALVEINGHKYRIDKMAAFDAMHFVRRMSALVGGDVKDVTQALSAIPDHEFETTIGYLLKYVYRADPSGAGFAPLAVNGKLMYGDVDLIGLLDICSAVFRDNIADFLPILANKLAGSKTPTI